MTALLAISVAVSFLSSCDGSGHKKDFKDSVDAVKTCQEYLSRLKLVKSLSFDRFSVSVFNWKSLDDSVCSFISHDASSHNLVVPIPEYRLLKDSIKNELFRIADTQSLSFKDYLHFRNSMLSRRMCDAAGKANRHAAFFTSLDSLSIRKETALEVLDSYKDFLRRTEASDINTKSMFLEFLKSEDILFRSFLNHLHSMNDVSVADITAVTDKICGDIMRKAGTGMISLEDAVIYMIMRSNRRLLLNASSCVADVRDGKVKTSVQKTAYLGMILQPFLSIDDFGWALLTPEQKQQFDRLSADLPCILNILSGESGMYMEMTDRLPIIALKLYIDKL